MPVMRINLLENFEWLWVESFINKKCIRAVKTDIPIKINQYTER